LCCFGILCYFQKELWGWLSESCWWVLGSGTWRWKLGKWMYFLSSCFLVLEDRDVKKTESLIVMALLFS
jgi:hypothetical protein